MGRFDERATQPARGFVDMLRWKVLRRGGPKPKTKLPKFEPPIAAPDLALLRSVRPSLTWVGHATFLARLGGKLFATDPVWSKRLQGIVPRQSPPGVALADAGTIDVVLVTHNHADHLDVPTLKEIGPTALYVTPLGNGDLLRGVGLLNVVELDWWESHRLGDGLEVTLVPSRHWSMRNPFNRNDMLWGGFVVKSRDGTLYHAGDTAYFDGFREIGARVGPIDWALLPIGAYEPRWFMEPQHMNPDDAMKAFELLGARTMVAMHWGTFQLTDEPLAEPPEKMQAIWRERGRNPDGLWVMRFGETRALATRPL